MKFHFGEKSNIFSAPIGTTRNKFLSDRLAEVGVVWTLLWQRRYGNVVL